MNSNSLKDTKDTSAPYEVEGFHSESLTISYTKTNKLITALYMVTDIVSDEEPLRNKLRTLGIEIISDIHLLNQNNIGHLASTVHAKVSQVMSFLELAFTINIVSEMNYSILKKEFTELSRSIKESTGKAGMPNKGIDLAEFFKEDPRASLGAISSKGHLIGHQKFTRIGVQKGSTLLKAIKDMSKRVPSLSGVQPPTRVDNFGVLKKQRRNDIINIIKLVGGNATIKDIKDKVRTSLKYSPTGDESIGQVSSLVSYGEKTLQRELVSMVKDGVLNKTGAKRWSRYFLKN